MIASRAVRLTLAAMLVAAPACAREKPGPAPKEFVFGARRVQVIVPDGWEALDQGRQKRFRRGEFSIVLQFLGPSTSPPRDLDELIDWGLAELGAEIGPDSRREVKSRRPVVLDGREAFDIETWNRLDHTNPQRIFFVKVDGGLLALHTERMAFGDTLAAFDAIRDSLHLVSAER
jgi:hypothetical protein